jgi:hypothetical protein
MSGAPASSRGLKIGNVVLSNTVVASPAAAAETVIASLTLPAVPSAAAYLWAFAVITGGTGATAANLRIRQTDINGGVVIQTTNIGTAAGSTTDYSLFSGIVGAAAQVYVLTVVMVNATGASTVQRVGLMAVGA